MKQIGLRNLIPLPPRDSPLPSWHTYLLTSLRAWEMYAIVLIAALLRLYGIATTQFDSDQAKIFRMAYDAVHHGMLVATANGASLPLLNPPATIYFLMLPAAFSSDPVWAAVMTALLAIAAVWLTYILTRRYFGRLAGSLAALLYATAGYPIIYSRFIWNQNFLLLFIPIFILILLQGVIERRKGWLAFAIPLLGLLYQFHGSSSLLATALLVALLLSPGTLRWRDAFFGALGLLLIYSPYLLWERYNHFHDIQVLLTATGQGSQIDNLAFLYYQQFLTPYNDLFTKVQTVLKPLSHPFIVSGSIVTILTILAGATALLSGLFPRGNATENRERGGLIRWYHRLCTDPASCGLLLLFVWQMGPLLLLIHHSINLYQHYLIILLPGPFIVLGIFLAGLITWAQHTLPWPRITPRALYLITLLLIAAQLGSSAAIIRSLSLGSFKESDWSSRYYNDLNTLQSTVKHTDEVAQRMHLNHIYISTDDIMREALQYLSEHTQTATTVFSDNCLTLPGSGPALMLVGPYSSTLNALVRQYASTTLLEKIPRLSGGPFWLYKIEPLTRPTQATRATFTQELQLQTVDRFELGQSKLAVTHWNMLRAAASNYQTSYSYEFTNLAQNGPGNNQICTLTALRAGDELLVPFSLPASNQMEIQASFHTTSPLVVKLLPGLPIPFETAMESSSVPIRLQTSDGKNTVMVTIS